MSEFTQPICDDCWDKTNPERLSSRAGVGDLERCCMCGEKTRSGIYVRVDPTTVTYAG